MNDANAVTERERRECRMGGNEEEHEAEVEKRVVRVFRERAKW